MKIQPMRRATQKGVAAVNRLLPQLASALVPNELPKDFDQAALRAVLRQKNMTLLVAYEHDRIVGMASIYFEHLCSKDTAWIEDVIVDGTARGRGIGKALCEALIKRARERGVKEVNLTSRPEREAANAMYVHLGFVRRETNVYRMVLHHQKG